MTSKAYLKWRKRFDSTGRIDPIELGQSQSIVKDILGDPDEVSIARKKNNPIILRYLNMEFHFDFINENEGELVLIYEEVEPGITTTSIRKK